MNTSTDNHAQAPAASLPEESQLIAERRSKLAAVRAKGIAFPNDFKPAFHVAELAHKYGPFENADLEPQNVRVSIAGRMMLKRVMGKASFCTLQDGSMGPTAGRIQLFVTRD